MLTFQGNLTPRAPDETYKIELQASKRYVIELEGSGSDALADPFLIVLGEDGEYIEDDSTSDDGAALIEFRPNRTQYYDITALAATSMLGAYTLTVKVDDYRDTYDCAARAGKIDTEGDRTQGRINEIGDVDIFELRLIKGLTYNLRLDSGPKGTDYVGDPKLTLLSATGKVIAADDNSGKGDAAHIVHTATRNGPHYLSAEAADEDTGTYYLFASIGSGSYQGDTIKGTLYSDSINALAGDDKINGRDGNDRIWGATGDDELKGGRNDDTIRGGTGMDEIYGNEGRDILYGEAGNDRIDGGQQSDRIYGGDGGDTLIGSLGSDNIQGGIGDDLLRGGEDWDNLYGDEGSDTLKGGDSTDYLRGGADNDSLLGGLGNDSLYGEDGDDTLDGGSGRDWYSGGSGNDVFVFTNTEHSPQDRPDNIYEFDQPGAEDGDLIDLSRIDGDSTRSGRQSLVFDSDGSKETGTVWLKESSKRYDSSIFVLVNTDDDEEPELKIDIYNYAGRAASDYTADDFIL